MPRVARFKEPIPAVHPLIRANEERKLGIESRILNVCERSLDFFEKGIGYIEKDEAKVLDKKAVERFNAKMRLFLYSFTMLRAVGSKAAANLLAGGAEENDPKEAAKRLEAQFESLPEHVQARILKRVPAPHMMKEGPVKLPTPHQAPDPFPRDPGEHIPGLDDETESDDTGFGDPDEPEEG